MDALSSVSKQSEGANSRATESAARSITQSATSKWRLLAYAGFALPWSLAGLPILVYLPAFYAKELHIASSWVGIVFLSARLWDAASDVLVGWLSDRSLSRLGRRKPWVMIGAPFLVLSTWLLCNPPQGAGLLYLSVCAGLFYSAATVVGIPYLSWGAELATGYVERSRVTAFRESFNMLGNLFFAAAPLLLLPSTAPLQSVLILISVAVLILVPLTAIPLGCWVSDPPPSQRTDMQLFKGLTILGKDKVFTKFLIAPFFTFFSGGVANSLIVFSLGVGLQLPDRVFTVIFVVYIATMFSLPATFRLGRNIEKHHLLASAYAVQSVAYLVLMLAPSGNLPIVLTTWAIVGIANAAVYFLPTSMLADVIDFGEVSQGQRRAGAYVGVYNLIAKLGLALGVGLSFGLLDVLNFAPDAAHHGEADVRNIRLLGFGLPLLLFAPAIWALLTYPITRTVHRRLREQIDARTE